MSQKHVYRPPYRPRVGPEPPLPLELFIVSQAGPAFPPPGSLGGGRARIKRVSLQGQG